MKYYRSLFATRPVGCYRRLVSIEALVCISGFFDALSGLFSLADLELVAVMSSHSNTKGVVGE